MQDALLTLGMGKQYGKFMQEAGIAKKLKNGKWTAIQKLHVDRFENFKNIVSQYQKDRRHIRIEKQVIAPKMSAAPEQMSLFKRFFLYLKQIFIK